MSQPGCDVGSARSKRPPAQPRCVSSEARPVHAPNLNRHRQDSSRARAPSGRRSVEGSAGRMRQVVPRSGEDNAAHRVACLFVASGDPHAECVSTHNFRFACIRSAQVFPNLRPSAATPLSQLFCHERLLHMSSGAFSLRFRVRHRCIPDLLCTSIVTEETRDLKFLHRSRKRAIIVSSHVLCFCLVEACECRFCRGVAASAVRRCLTEKCTTCARDVERQAKLDTLEGELAASFYLGERISDDSGTETGLAVASRSPRGSRENLCGSTWCRLRPCASV